MVERERPLEAHLLRAVNNSSMPACGRFSATSRRVASSIAATAALSSAPRIVPARVPHHAVGDDGLDRSGRRDRVEMGAQEDRLAGRGRLERDEDVAHRRADLRPRVVLVHRQPAVAQVADHAIRDGALLAGRARDRRELQEQIEDVRLHRTERLRDFDGDALPRPARAPRRRTRGRAAPGASAAT